MKYVNSHNNNNSIDRKWRN